MAPADHLADLIVQLAQHYSDDGHEDSLTDWDHHAVAVIQHALASVPGLEDRLRRHLALTPNQDAVLHLTLHIRLHYRSILRALERALHGLSLIHI